MSARERDRLKVLHEVGKRHITQKQAGVELGLSARWVRTLLKRLRREGDRALRHRPLERAGGQAHAVWLSAIDGAAAARRDAGQSQAGVPAVPRGRVGDEDSAAAADPLEWRSNEPSRHEAE